MSSKPSSDALTSERALLGLKLFPSRRKKPKHNRALDAWLRTLDSRVAANGGVRLAGEGLPARGGANGHRANGRGVNGRGVHELDAGGQKAPYVAVFDDVDALRDVVELAIELLRPASLLDVVAPPADGRAEGERPTLRAAFVICLDADQRGGPASVRALLGKAKRGEIVVGPRAYRALRRDLLAARRFSCAGGTAVALDRERPFRRGCLSALQRLAEPEVPPSLVRPRASAQERVDSGQPCLLVFRGPTGAGAEPIIQSLRRAHPEARILPVGPTTEGVVPLASLRLALQRMGRPRLDDPQLEDSLARVERGELVDRVALSVALGHLLSTLEPWLHWCGPLDHIDRATCDVLCAGCASDEVYRARSSETGFEGAAHRAERTTNERLTLLSHVQLASLSLSAALPPRWPEPLDLPLPALKLEDARAVAADILGLETDDPVVRRIGVLGGDTVLGIVECIRTLIATGDLVESGGAFAWRTRPRKGARAIPMEAWLAERMALVSPDAQRLLELLALTPAGLPWAELLALAARDGLDAGETRAAGEELVAHALCTQTVGTNPPRRSSHLSRSWMSDDVLRSQPARSQPPSGQPPSSQAGRNRVALPGGATAIRKTLASHPVVALPDAARTSSTLPGSTRPGSTLPGSTLPGGAPPGRTLGVDGAIRDAVWAVMDHGRRGELCLHVGDHMRGLAYGGAASTPRLAAAGYYFFRAGADRPAQSCLEQAASETGDAGYPAAATRLLDLARSRPARRRPPPPIPRDALRKSSAPPKSSTPLPPAWRALLDALSAGHSAQARRILSALPVGDGKRLLAEALIELETGRPVAGIRASLAALSRSRRTLDPRGESAALLTLAACYRAMGLTDAARALQR